MEQQARANELQSSGDSGMQRRVVVTGFEEETEEEGKTKTTAMDIYIKGTGRREGDTRNGPAMPKRLLVIAGTPGSRPKVAGVGREVAPCGWMDVDIFMKMPLDNFTNYSQFF
jgi:hypothetical protein